MASSSRWNDGRDGLRRGIHAGWLQAFVAVNPVSHLVTAERALLGGHPAAGPIAWVLLASAALAAVFATVTTWLYGRQR
jgi:ABC-2 type transport system permease protein